MAQNRFKKAAPLASQLYKTGRYKTYADAMRAALNKDKKVGAIKKRKKRQTGTSNKKNDRQRSAKAPGKRRSASKKVGKPRVSISVRGNSIGIGDAKRLITRNLKEKLSRLLLMHALATNKPNKRRIAKQIKEVKTELKKYS